MKPLNQIASKELTARRKNITHTLRNTLVIGDNRLARLLSTAIEIDRILHLRITYKKHDWNGKKGKVCLNCGMKRRYQHRGIAYYFTGKEELLKAPNCIKR